VKKDEKHRDFIAKGITSLSQKKVLQKNQSKALALLTFYALYKTLNVCDN
jgi:hypothetical protein